jgi:hypothetical protein
MKKNSKKKVIISDCYACKYYCKTVEVEKGCPTNAWILFEECKYGGKTRNLPRNRRRIPKWCPLKDTACGEPSPADKCRKCGSRNMKAVEYDGTDPCHYDGISEFRCEDCGARFGRWTGRELQDGDYERPYGRETKT